MRATHVIADRWREAIANRRAEELVGILIPDIVDQTIFALLHAIDDGALSLSFSASNGATVDLNAEGLGELSGWYIGSEGWREKYSSERFVDDFAD
ncbi:MAG: hypothetical protein KDA32_01885 [Phycisphaerales bacterium]|nr:hypothetical protein [Phycisphaerales bacterium]